MYSPAPINGGKLYTGEPAVKQQLLYTSGSKDLDYGSSPGGVTLALPVLTVSSNWVDSPTHERVIRTCGSSGAQGRNGALEVDAAITSLAQLGLSEFTTDKHPVVTGKNNNSWVANATNADTGSKMSFQNLPPPFYPSASVQASLNAAQHRAITGQQTLTSSEPQQRPMHETYAMNGLFHTSWGNTGEFNSGAYGGRHAVHLDALSNAQARRFLPRGCTTAQFLTSPNNFPANSWVPSNSRPNYPFPSHVIQQNADRRASAELKGMEECKESGQKTSSNHQVFFTNGKGNFQFAKFDFDYVSQYWIKIIYTVY